MYKPKHFELYELLPRYFYNKYKNMEYELWLMFDKDFLHTLDQLRGEHGIIVLNDWYWEGENQYCGWRPWNCTVGEKFSQHKFARAGDPFFKERPLIYVIEQIKKYPLRYPTITYLKRSITRMHFDCGNR